MHHYWSKPAVEQILHEKRKLWDEGGSLGNCDQTSTLDGRLTCLNSKYGRALETHCVRTDSAVLKNAAQGSTTLKCTTVKRPIKDPSHFVHRDNRPDPTQRILPRRSSSGCSSTRAEGARPSERDVLNRSVSPGCRSTQRCAATWKSQQRGSPDVTFPKRSPDIHTHTHMHGVAPPPKGSRLEAAVCLRCLRRQPRRDGASAGSESR